MRLVRLAVEGKTDVPVAERLVRAAGREPIEQYLVAHGKFPLTPRIREILGSANGLDWLILRDLDHDAPCASALVEQLAGTRAVRGVHLRIAVRAIESWLLADHTAFAEAFAVLVNHLPAWPDQLEDPKEHLITLCRRSRNTQIRVGMTPRPGSGRRVGIQYADRIIAFARDKWDPARAAQRSPSLARTLRALARPRAEGGWRP